MEVMGFSWQPEFEMEMDLERNCGVIDSVGEYMEFHSDRVCSEL